MLELCMKPNLIMWVHADSEHMKQKMISVKNIVCKLTHCNTLQQETPTLRKHTAGKRKKIRSFGKKYSEHFRKDSLENKLPEKIF